MPIRISERKLLAAIVLFAISLYTLLKVKLIATPVYVSEKGIVIVAGAIVILIVGLRLFKTAISEV
jgi:hypothetical protein